MSVKRVSIISLSALALAAGVYLYQLSPSERWLLFWKTEAQTYADAMLAKGSVSKKVSDDFIDVLTVTNSKKRTVLFSPHDKHEVAVVYAPDNFSDNLVYDNVTAKRIRKNWYALP